MSADDVGRDGLQRISIGSVEELVTDYSPELSGVVFYRLEGRVNDDVFELGAVDPEAEANFGIAMRVGDGRFGVRMTAESTFSQGSVHVDAAIGYEYDPRLDIPAQVAVDFGNRVGLMALYPYVRQAFSQMSATVLGKAVFLPMLRQGEVAFSVDAGDGQVVSPEASSEAPE